MEAVADGAEASSIDVEEDESSFGIRDDGKRGFVDFVSIVKQVTNDLLKKENRSKIKPCKVSLLRKSVAM